MKIPVLSALALLLAACAAPGSGSRPAGLADLSPSAGGVEVLQSIPTDRSYIELGRIDVPADRGDAIEQLVEEAEALGADAVLLLGATTRQVEVPQPGFPGTIRSFNVPLMRLSGIALKYTERAAS